MQRVWLRSGRILAGMLLAALYATPQTYTVSARPGAVNYIEGTAYLNGNALSHSAARTSFLNANDTLSTGSGKAEVLLTPGVFMRLGDNSEIRMISPSLTDTQLEVKGGEVIIEAAGLVKENNIQVIEDGASITIRKNGLYRFTAGNPPVAAVLEGKEDVRFGDRQLQLGKNRETVLSASLKPEKFDPKKEDELYAWSNIRSEYESAASYSSATAASASNFGPWGGYGLGGYNPGWFWNAGFDSYAWLPGDGAFFSPFGYGFYGPGVVGYAPVVIAPVYRGGHWNHGDGSRGNWSRDRNHEGVPVRAAVPVNANRPPVVGPGINSPWANHIAREQIARSLGENSFRTGNGAPAAAFAGRNGGGFAHPVGGNGAGVHSGGGGGFHSAGGGGGFHGGGAPGAGGGAHGGGGGGHR